MAVKSEEFPLLVPIRLPCASVTESGLFDNFERNAYEKIFRIVKTTGIRLCYFRKQLFRLAISLFFRFFLGREIKPLKMYLRVDVELPRNPLMYATP